MFLLLLFGSRKWWSTQGRRNYSVEEPLLMLIITLFVVVGRRGAGFGNSNSVLIVLSRMHLRARDSYVSRFFRLSGCLQQQRRSCFRSSVVDSN